MRALALSFAAASLLAACAQLPKIAPSLSPAPLNGCEQLFENGRWQFHHLIEATVRDRSMGQLTGVSVISSGTRTIDCALMTLEGLVLFSARYDGRLTITRAVSPFDRPGFAQGLMDDLMLLFFKPVPPLLIQGELPGGEAICRYETTEGAVTDVILVDNQHWAIHSYSPEGRRQRTIMGKGATAGPVTATHLTIQSHGRMEYVLQLELLEALQLNP